MDLHKTERVILCELDCNSRQTLSSIGKRARIKKESVHYRIQQLEAKGIIKGYPSIVSLAKRGKMHAEFYLKFRNVTRPLKQEILHYLQRLPEASELASCRGSWDFLIGVVVNDVYELNAFKNHVFNAYAPYLATSSLSFTIETYFFGRKYLVGKNIHLAQQVDAPGKEETDALDEAILSELARNARQSLRRIAEIVGSTPKTVAYRIRNLEQQGIVQKYTVAIDLEKLGLTTYKLLIRLKNSAHKKRFFDYFHTQPNTVSVREVLAQWNLEPTIEVESPEQFYAIIEEMEDRFGESIESHSSFMLDKIYRTSYYS
ncbi:Lrp/AsnC family transcriptional regulator [Candidatus Woesearchaeota archaeon]|nr:MAG: Lrp/AsnC family transcriptional regulator [Candidatus Woesearchaeota archaeon]